MDNFGSGGRKKNFSISHSGKFKSKNRKRISITDEIWIGPVEGFKNKVIEYLSSEAEDFVKITSLNSLQTSTEAQRGVIQPPIDENEPQVVISDKKLSSDKSIHGTANNQNKADYKVAADET